MQTHTDLLTRHLDRRGVTQTVLTSRLSGPRTVERVDGATVHRLGVRTAHLRQLWTAQALPRLLADPHRPDLVHAHQGEDLAALPLALAASRRSGCPLIVTVHCSVEHTLQPVGARSAAVALVGAPLERAVLRRADAVITLTEATADKLSDGGIDADRIHVIPSGVDLASHRRPRRDPLPHVGHPRVVYVGRLVPQKSVDTLIRAAAILGIDARVVIVGDGPDRGKLTRLVADLDLTDRMTFTGFIPYASVPAMLQHADVLVLPSLYEEMGSVLVQALATATPVVATDVGGVATVVEDGATGLLVPPLDPAALAAAPEAVLADPSLARRLAANAARAAERYSWDVLAGAVLDVYRSVIGQPVTASATSPT
ncbi:MAG: glycosyltransferase family 4 protein [Actinomycetota bacterium]|nr:glycosyltransferase family 4 protein [Actinomycetota bacterium]